jgi:UDP-N-acetylmuramoylalanine--D-glutamate ligase
MVGIKSSCAVLDNWSALRARDFGDFENTMTVQEKIQNRRIGIVGMARSGLAAAQLASRLGGKPFVSDTARHELLIRQTELLSSHAIPFETGGHTERVLENDYIVVSPGVLPTTDILTRARDRGLPVFSELEFASWVCRGTLIAITGSNGKTTTTALTGEIFRTAGKPTFVCGNIGEPFSDVADKITENGFAVKFRRFNWKRSQISNRMWR